MLAIDRLTRINTTLHRLSSSFSSTHSSAEILNHPESLGFPGKFVPGIPGSTSSSSSFCSASAQQRLNPYEMPCPKSWKSRENGSGGITVERSDRPGVVPSSAGVVEIHVQPNRHSPSLLVSNMGSINHNTYPALPETSNPGEARTQRGTNSTPPLLDGDATPTNERKNSDRNQRTIKSGPKVKCASREEPMDFYHQVEPHIARENGFSSYSTLPRKFSCKRKMAGFDNSFGAGDEYRSGFNGNPEDVSVRKEFSRDLGHFSSVEAGEASNKRKKEPPPPPKRTDSFKTDSKSLYGIARDKPRLGDKAFPLAAGVFPDSALKPSADLRLVASGNSGVVAGTAASSQNTVRTSVNLPPSENSLRSSPATASGVPGNIANPGADWQDRRMSECSDDSDSGLESRHSASSVSLESSGSGGTIESNTLPFANENVGTIKQRNPSAKPSILNTAAGEPGKLNASLFENGSATIRRGNSRTSTERTDNGEVPGRHLTFCRTLTVVRKFSETVY